MKNLSHVGRGIVPMVVAFTMMQMASLARAQEEKPAMDDGMGDVEVAEPFFMEKAAVESSLEFGFGVDASSTEKEYELGAGASWVVFDHLQLGVDIPYVIVDPEVGSTQSGIGDIEFSAKYQALDMPVTGINLSIGASVAVLSGSRDKETGGTGEWSVFALADKVVSMGENMPDLNFHLRLGYSQNIKVSAEEIETAETLGVSGTRRKEFSWGGAVEMPLADGRFTPDLEIIGTTVLNSVDPDEESTIVEVGGGAWMKPFPEDSRLGPVSIGVGVKAPVTDKRESDFSALAVVKYDFE